MTKTQEISKTQTVLIVKIIEWAQKHKIKVEDLTARQIRTALK